MPPALFEINIKTNTAYTMNTTNLHPEDIRPGVYLIAPDGNLFKADGFFYDGDDKLHIVMNGSNGLSLFSCSGIPLTESVLIAVGAKKHNFTTIWMPVTNLKSELHFEVFENTPEIVTTLISAMSDPAKLIFDRIRYLHELQNLYRSLTGTDLTINVAQLAEAVKGANYE